MKKNSFHLLILCLLALAAAMFISGCQKSENKADPQYQLKELAKNEKQWLAKTEPLAEETRNLYTKWANNEITREELEQQYKDTYTKLQDIKDKYEEYLNKNPLSKETENNPDYKEGLTYGKKVRSDLNNFLYTVTEGFLDKSTNKLTKVNEQQLKILYKDRIENTYNEHLQKLQNALKKYE